MHRLEQVTIHGDTTVTATFTQDHYTLTIDKSAMVQSRKTPDQAHLPLRRCSHSDLPHRDPGWSFGSWSANATGGTVTIHGNTTVTATFTQDEYTLTIDKVGSGTVTKDPDHATYHYGDVVTLTCYRRSRLDLW